MSERAHKRQKTSSVTKTASKKAKVAPAYPTLDAAHYDALADDAAKDDEERRLESLLFGTAFESASKGKGKATFGISVLDADDEHGGGGREFENMLDTDLFVIDDNGPPSSIASFIPQNNDEASDTESHASHSRSRSPSTSHSASSPPPKTQPLVSQRAAWIDADDSTLAVSLSAPRLRKLRDAPDESILGGREYERRLRRQFERINPTPAWASRRTGNTAKRMRDDGFDATDGSGEDNDEDDVEGLLKSTSGLAGKRKLRVLEKGTLSIERLRDANISAPAEGAVRCVAFHPSPDVPVLAVASADRRVRLFNVDGHTNPSLSTLHLPALPVSRALWHPGGTQLLLAGARPFFHVYDPNTGTTQRSPRGLWGTASNAAGQDLSLETSAFSPDGARLAIAGRGGRVHVVDFAARAGGAQVVGGVKANRPVRALAWAPNGELMSVGDDAEVCVWDVRMFRCLRRWKDESAFGARVGEVDRSGKYFAIGSSTGYVNLYGSDAVGSVAQTKPSALKALGNLTTPVSVVRFNNDAQLLAIASDDKKDQLRLIHTASMTAFSNWPTSGTPLGHVSSVDFSAQSEYVAIGNSRGRVLLYQLRDYTT